LWSVSGRRHDWKPSSGDKKFCPSKGKDDRRRVGFGKLNPPGPKSRKKAESGSIITSISWYSSDHRGGESQKDGEFKSPFETVEERLGGRSTARVNLG